MYKALKYFLPVILASLLTVFTYSQNSIPEPRQDRLLNGLHVLLWPDANASKVSVRVRVHSGAAFDPQGKEGVMAMLAEGLFPNQATREFFAEDLGGGLEIVTTYDYIEIDASAAPENILTVLETLSSALANPTIDKETTAKLREELTARAVERSKNLAYVADRAAAKRLFGTFPYGRPSDGDQASIANISFADLIDAKQRFLTADNATITVSGKFDRSLVAKAIRRYFGAWLKADRSVPSTFRQPDDPSTALETVASPDPEQFAIRFGLRGTARSDKSFAASQVAARVIEGRLRSSVGSEHDADVYVRSDSYFLPGIFLIAFDGRKSGGPRPKIEVSELIPKAMTTPLTEAEFGAAKQAFRSEWAKKDAVSIWLDSDTYNMNDASSIARIAERVTFDEVKGYMDRLNRQPAISVLVNTPKAEQ